MTDEAPFPGTTRKRSDKALGRVRRDPIEPEIDEEEEEPWDANPISIKTKSGVTYECFKIGSLAKAWDNRTVYSIYKLEQRGFLPKATLRKKPSHPGKIKGDRLYTRQQIETVIELAKKYGVYERRSRVKFQDTGFTQELLQSWTP